MNGFEPAEGHGQRRADRRSVDRPGCNVDPAGNVDGDNRDTGVLDGTKYLGRRRAQRTGTRDAHHRVDHQIGTGTNGLRHPAGRVAEGGQCRAVGALGVEQNGIGRDASAAQQRRRPQSIATVVTGTDDDADPPAGDSPRAATQFTGDRGGQTGRGAAHQRAVGQGSQQWRLGRPNLFGGVIKPHQVLFDRNRFGEVARFVDIVSAGPGHRSSEDLQRNRRKQRLEKR